MRTIFSKIKLNKCQVTILSALVLLSAVGEMLLPSLLAQMINSGVANAKNRLIFKIKLNKCQVTILSALVLLSAVGEMLLPSLLAQMINSGVANAKNRLIFTLAGVMAGITVLACIINFLSVKLAARISTDFSARLRGEVFDKVQSFSAAELDRFGVASLVTRSTSDITNIQLFLTMLLRIGILAPMMAVAGLVFSAATGGKVSSVLTVAIPVLLIGVGGIVMFASRYSIRLRQKLDQINRLFLESLEGVRVIRAFNKQVNESRRFGEANKEYTQTAMTTAMTAGKITSFLMPAINVIFGVTTAAVLGLGAVYVESGAMEVGSLVANSQYISMVLMSVMLFAMVIMMFPTTYACRKNHQLPDACHQRNLRCDNSRCFRSWSRLCGKRSYGSRFSGG